MFLILSGIFCWDSQVFLLAFLFFFFLLHSQDSHLPWAMSGHLLGCQLDTIFFLSSAKVNLHVESKSLVLIFVLAEYYHLWTSCPFVEGCWIFPLGFSILVDLSHILLDSTVHLTLWGCKVPPTFELNIKRSEYSGWFRALEQDNTANKII